MEKLFAKMKELSKRCKEEAKRETSCIKCPEQKLCDEIMYLGHLINDTPNGWEIDKIEKLLNEITEEQKLTHDKVIETINELFIEILKGEGK